MLDFSFTNQFKKDLKLMEKRRKDLDKIFELITIIIWGDSLPEKYKDHALSGTYNKFRECHIEPDWLLIYRTDDEKVLFYHTGTHSDFF
jgi:mRNA interferase YafQ